MLQQVAVELSSTAKALKKDNEKLRKELRGEQQERHSIQEAALREAQSLKQLEQALRRDTKALKRDSKALRETERALTSSLDDCQATIADLEAENGRLRTPFDDFQVRLPAIKQFADLSKYSYCCTARLTSCCGPHSSLFHKYLLACAAGFSSAVVHRPHFCMPSSPNVKQTLSGVFASPPAGLPYPNSFVPWLPTGECPGDEGPIRLDGRPDQGAEAAAVSQEPGGTRGARDAAHGRSQDPGTRGRADGKLIGSTAGAVILKQHRRAALGRLHCVSDVICNV